jgi:hypothetical protein
VDLALAEGAFHTAFLLARGAGPQPPGRTPAEAEAKLLGHWLAAEIIRAWTAHPAREQEQGRACLTQPVLHVLRFFQLQYRQDG